MRTTEPVNKEFIEKNSNDSLGRMAEGTETHSFMLRNDRSITLD